MTNYKPRNCEICKKSIFQIVQNKNIVKNVRMRVGNYLIELGIKNGIEIKR